jgi:signal transduction histidine kinase
MAVIQQEGTGVFEYRVLRPSESARHIAAYGELGRNAAGAPVSIFGTVLDVTELRQKERELQERNDELARFTYTVSHDLKSPLVTITTFLGFLEQDVRRQDAARMEKDLGYIRGAADKMARLLDELLGLSRVGRKMNPFIETPLQAIVQDARSLVAGRLTTRGVHVQVTSEPVLLYGDRPRLVEVFQNLLDNAVKFMGQELSPCIDIGIRPQGADTIVCVRDNGIGIDPRHQHKLFGLFEKLDPGAEGTGMGLALVRRIVDVHGGRIWVESEGAGKGATFCFTLAKTRRVPREEFSA